MERRFLGHGTQQAYDSILVKYLYLLLFLSFFLMLENSFHFLNKTPHSFSLPTSLGGFFNEVGCS